MPNYHDAAVNKCGVFRQLNTPHADNGTSHEYAPTANRHCTMSFIMTLLTRALHHSTQKHPEPPMQRTMFQLPAHPTTLSTDTFHCHNYSNCPPTLKSSAALHDQCACAVAQTRPTCTVVVSERKAAR